MSNLYIARSGTLLPVPETRIGDSTINVGCHDTMSVTAIMQQCPFLWVQLNEAYVAIFNNVFSQVFKEPIPTLGGFLINNCKSKWEQVIICIPRYIPTTKNPLDGKFSSIPCPLVSLTCMIQGSLELSFFRVIVIIRFRLTRNDIISVQSVNLIVIVIDGTIQHIRVPRVKRKEMSEKAGMSELLYWVEVTIEDNTQLLCVIFKDNAQQPCVILEDNAQLLCVILLSLSLKITHNYCAFCLVPFFFQ
ncbi:hypothetical protein M9H77_31949 [Catharanthus roseus]|uniref:Uncharacterized protein n=1 Tax=Catharanthus roseus TaxID=4058 RepID=A0ACC0A1I9_CATRO|nr:hypothetical protein M9H77_31949 [Catharanthus roseus]